MMIHSSDPSIHTRGDIYQDLRHEPDVIAESEVRNGASFTLSAGDYYYRYTATGAGGYSISLRRNDGHTLAGPANRVAPEPIDIFRFRVV